MQVYIIKIKLKVLHRMTLSDMHFNYIYRTQKIIKISSDH